MRSSGVVAVLLVLAILTPSQARAGDGIVLESYTGARPEDAKKALGPLLEELAGRGYVLGAEMVGRAYESRISRPSGTFDDLTIGFGDKIEAGKRAWASGKFDEAISVLVPLINQAHQSPGALIGNASLRDKLGEGLMVLALSQERQGDPSAARDTIGEFVRSFPDVTVDRAKFGPDAANKVDQLRKDQLAAPKGRLQLMPSDEQAEVYVNEHLEGRGKIVKELPPGDYRVILLAGSQRSRNHHVRIVSGQKTTATIDLAADATVYTGPDWSGLLFGAGTDREKLEASYATAFANALDAKALVVVGLDTVHNQRAIVGAVVALMNGREVRRASVPLSPTPTTEQLQALARFLAGEKVTTAGIDVQLDNVASDDKPRWRGWPWITGALALGAVGGGVALLALDGTCPDGSKDPNCPNLYSTATPGWVLVGGGAVLAGLTVYLFLTQPAKPERATRQVYLAPAPGGGALAGFTTTF